MQPWEWLVVRSAHSDVQPEGRQSRVRAQAQPLAQALALALDRLEVEARLQVVEAAALDLAAMVADSLLVAVAVEAAAPVAAAVATPVEARQVRAPQVQRQEERARPHLPRAQ